MNKVQELCRQLKERANRIEAESVILREEIDKLERMVSLEQLVEMGMDFADYGLSPEEILLEAEENDTRHLL